MKVELTRIEDGKKEQLTIKDLLPGQITQIVEWEHHTGKIITAYETISGDLIAASIGTDDWWQCNRFDFPIRLLTPGEAIVIKE